MLIISNQRQYRYAFAAESVNGTKDYPPETIKTTKNYPPIFYSKNPRYSLYFTRQEIYNVVSPQRRERMADICEATQIRFVNFC